MLVGRKSTANITSSLPLQLVLPLVQEVDVRVGKEGWINGQSCGRCWIVMMIRLPGNAVIQFSAERTMQRSGQLCNRGHHSCKIIVIAQCPPPLGQSRDEGLSWSGLGLDARCLTYFSSVFCRRIIKNCFQLIAPCGCQRTVFHL